MALSAKSSNQDKQVTQVGTGSNLPAPKAKSAETADIWLRWLSEMLPANTWFALYSSNDYQLFAQLPDQHRLSAQLPAFAKQAVERGEPCQCPLPDGEEGAEALALPLVDAHGKSQVLLFDSEQLDITQKQSTVRLILWASRWLGIVEPSKKAVTSKLTTDISSLQHKLIFDFDQHSSVASAAMALVNELAEIPSVFRVSVAEFTGAKLRLLAVSGLSKLDSRRASAQLMQNAMQEVLTSDTTTSFVNSSQAIEFPAHQQLVRSTKQGNVHGLMHRQNNERDGVVVLIEQHTASPSLDATTLTKELEPSLALLGVMHRSKRSVPRKLRDEATNLVESVRDNRFLDKHLLVFVCSILAITALLLPVPHRVTVRAAIEASDRQVLVAPQEGYVLSSHARAGDTVQEGALLATLDGRDLQLVVDKWQGELLKNKQEYAKALAEHDRISLSQLRAESLRLEAELALAAQQLNRSELRAPFEGVLLSGDLSQSLGSPVEEGQVLFEIGSKDAYRLQLDVDEHDIAYIQQGQSAKIRMTALPGVTWDATLENVLPVAIAEQGESSFRVPANISGEAEALRPGMAGVGKISVGSRSLIWVMTHAVTDRLRIWAWKLGLIK